MANSTLKGTLFLDANQDGSQEGADVGIGGVVVRLYSADGLTLIASTTSSASGAYSFSNVTPGNYQLVVVPPANDAFSPAGISTSLPNSLVSSAGVEAVTLTSGGTTTVNAGLHSTTTASFGGEAFVDANGDGLFDGSDAYLSGVTVQLYQVVNGVDSLVATTSTATDGSYDFTGLAAGTYYAHIVPPAGSTVSTQGVLSPPQAFNPGAALTAATNLLTNGNFTAYSVSGATTTITGWTASSNVPLTSPYGSGPGYGPEIQVTNGTSTGRYGVNEVADTVNPSYSGGVAAYFVDDGAIETLSQTVNLTAGQVYEIGFDLNEPSVGASNSGFFSITASINGQTITTTDSRSGTQLVLNKWTHFANLYTATTTGPVTLTFAYQSGVVGSSLASKDVLVDDVYIVKGQITADLTAVSQVNSSGNTAQVTLAAGQTSGNEDVGVYATPATIQGTVFKDNNGDGALNGGDAGLANQTVNLSLNGLVIGSAVTDASGKYAFTNLVAGTYVVTVVAGSGYRFSPNGTATGVADSSVGPSATPTVGGTQTVTVAAAGTGVANAGEYVAGTLSGHVFVDQNANGVQDSGDTNLAGVTVTLLNASGVSTGVTTTTNASGAYSFTGLSLGSYAVSFTAPTGYIFDPAVGSNASATVNNLAGATGVTPTVALTAGSTSANQNGAFYAPSTLSGHVFVDQNADGVQGAGDTNLAGVTVQLLDGSGAAIAGKTAVTDANGAYSFTGLAPGGYAVKFTAPTGDVFDPTVGANSSASGNNLAGATGVTPTVILTSGSSVANQNGALYAPSTLSGHVFVDLNADGVQRIGDRGLAGVTVQLLDGGGKAIAGKTAITSVDGYYSFTGLAPGGYSVAFAAPTGYVFDSATASGDPPHDAITGASGKTPTVNLVSGQTVTDQNAGVYQDPSVSGHIFVDRNADGVQQGGDANLAGVTVQLLDGSGNPIAGKTAVTDANGAYSFTNLPPGSYSVAFTAPAGYVFDAITGRSGVTPMVTLVSGQDATDQNAAVYQRASLSGHVFFDHNGNGVQDSDDQNVAGVTVSLLDSHGAPTGLTAVTDADGAYTFTGLVPAGYSVSFTASDGDRFDKLVGTAAAAIDSIVNSLGVTPQVTLNSGDHVTDQNAGEHVICFYPGTLIATPDGPRPVETLAIGDLVLTHQGRVMPVRWMGRQTVSTRLGDPLTVLPIRIRAGALGEGLPERDLLVSPCHAVLVDDILIQAGALLNGVSITREAAVPERFTYHHVELADHSLILAEGLPAETFIDSVEGRWFDNWAERPALDPRDGDIVELDYPRAQSARQVPRAIRARLAGFTRPVAGDRGMDAAPANDVSARSGLAERRRVFAA